MLDRETQFTSAITGMILFYMKVPITNQLTADFSGSAPLPVTLLNFNPRRSTTPLFYSPGRPPVNRKQSLLRHSAQYTNEC